MSIKHKPIIYAVYYTIVHWIPFKNGTLLQKQNGCFDLAVVILVAVLSDTQDTLLGTPCNLYILLEKKTVSWQLNSPVVL